MLPASGRVRLRLCLRLRLRGTAAPYGKGGFRNLTKQNHSLVDMATHIPQATHVLGNNYRKQLGTIGNYRKL